MDERRIEKPFLSPGGGAALRDIVHRLCDASDGLVRPGSRGAYPNLPSRDAVGRIVNEFRAVLFPGYFGTTGAVTADALWFQVGATLDRLARELAEQVRRAFCFTCEERDPSQCAECGHHAARVAETFIGRLPEIRGLLATDVQAAYEGDPAATSPAETILSYPGVFAVMCQRVAHELYRLQAPLLPRMITEHAHAVTGIDIHPGASIGDHFFIDHGTGVVVGETCEIGRRVRLYQSVTLGARSFQLDAKGNPVKGLPRHPIVEDDVVIYSGATVLGRITIGAGSTIGGNVWLTHSVAPGSRISQGQVRQLHYTDGAGI